MSKFTQFGSRFSKAVANVAIGWIAGYTAVAVTSSITGIELGDPRLEASKDQQRHCAPLEVVSG